MSGSAHRASQSPHPSASAFVRHSRTKFQKAREQGAFCLSKQVVSQNSRELIIVLPNLTLFFLEKDAADTMDKFFSQISSQQAPRSGNPAVTPHDSPAKAHESDMQASEANKDDATPKQLPKGVVLGKDGKP